MIRFDTNKDYEEYIRLHNQISHLQNIIHELDTDIYETIKRLTNMSIHDALDEYDDYSNLGTAVNTLENVQKKLKELKEKYGEKI